MTASSSVTAQNLQLIGGDNIIIALVDIEITQWRLTFRDCRWRKDPAGERITLGPCDCTAFEPYTTTERLDACINCTEWLSAWKREFLTSLAGWRGPLTPKQQQRVDELVDKLRRVARARGLAA
jgi:hypothetical protein